MVACCRTWQAVLAPQARGGQVYELGVPFVNFTNVVYVNKKLLDQFGLSFPKTLKDFEAQAPVIRKGGFRPVVFGDQPDWVLQSCPLSALVSRTGGAEWFDRVRYGEGGHSFNDPQSVTALQTVRDMTDAGLIDQSEPQTTRQQALSAFVSGKSVYFIGGIWEVVNPHERTAGGHEVSDRDAHFRACRGRGDDRRRLVLRRDRDRLRHLQGLDRRPS